MVAESQTQGVLSQNGHSNGSGTGPHVVVESPSHVKELYPKKTLGCTDGENAPALSLKVAAHLTLGPEPLWCCTEEWKARVDLAAIHRLCNNYNWNEGIQNHLTAAIPGRTDQFLIIAFGLLWSQVQLQAWPAFLVRQPCAYWTTRYHASMPDCSIPLASTCTAMHADKTSLLWQAILMLWCAGDCKQPSDC